MAEPSARLYLITPPLEDAAAFADRLAHACAAGSVAAVLARFAPADERTLISRTKVLAPAAQEHGAALLVATEGEVDLVTVASRGGADGLHVTGRVARIRDMVSRLKRERAVGAGGIRSKDDAMNAGEAGADYLLFGEPRLDGTLPAFETVVERAAWWAEIFETPCVAYAPSLDRIPDLVATKAEFVALGEAVWAHPEGPQAAVRLALDALDRTEAAP